MRTSFKTVWLEKLWSTFSTMSRRKVEMQEKLAIFAQRSAVSSRDGSHSEGLEAPCRWYNRRESGECTTYLGNC